MDQHDEMIWSLIGNKGNCSYKTTIGKAHSDDKIMFCKHPYNVTGLCNRTSCPLSNSKYATIREMDGKVYLYIKSPERQHSPRNWWNEKILLSRNYSKALQQLDTYLQHYPKVLMHRNKQRLTKIYQYLIRIRKIQLNILKGKKSQKLVSVQKKVEVRDGNREKKALKAANIEKNIQNELLQRLTNGTYGDIYNFGNIEKKPLLLKQTEEDESVEETTLEMEHEFESDEEEEEGVTEYVEDLEDDDDDDDDDEDSSDDYDESDDDEDNIDNLDYLGNNKWGNRFDDDDDDDDEDSDDDVDDDDDDDSDDDDQKKNKKKKKKSKSQPKKKKKKRGTRIEIEYEHEDEDNKNTNTTIANEQSNESAAVAAAGNMAW